MIGNTKPTLHQMSYKVGIKGNRIFQVQNHKLFYEAQAMKNTARRKIIEVK